MSFGQLRSARKAKESLSFVKALDRSTASGTSTEQPSSDVVAGSSGNARVVANDATLHVQEDLRPSSTPEVAKTKLVDVHGCHANLPAMLEIRESTRHGRGIYAKSNLAAGSLVLAATPHVSVLSTPNLDQFCSACAEAAPGAGLKRCQKCKIVWYCGAECQNRDWVWHKRECSALQKWSAAAPSAEVSVPGEAVRCLGRILWGSQKEGLDSVWAREIRMMHSNRPSLPPAGVETHTHLAHSVVRYLGITSPQELEPYGLNSAGDLVDLISRFTTNTFTLTAPSLTPIGICVAPIAAFANHSCNPNAVIVFPRASASPTNEPELRLVALRDIAAGTEVRISYVDTTLPKALRQRELKDVYGFTCQCKLCTRAPPADPREALWCPKGCGGMCPHPSDDNQLVRCVKCGGAVGNAEAALDALRVGQEALEKASSLQFKNPEKARQLAANIIPILTSAGVTPSSHPLLALTRLHQELLIASLPANLSQQTLDETIRCAGMYIAGLQVLLPKGHPVRAVSLGELGKLLAVDEPAPSATSDNAAGGRFPPSGPARLKLAYESLVRAHEEMLIGYGKADGGGQLGRDLRDSIVRLEKELGIWSTGIKNVLEDTMTGRAGSSSK